MKYRCESCCAYNYGCSYSGDPPECYLQDEFDFLEEQGVIDDTAGDETDCPLWETDCVKLYGPDLSEDDV